MNLARQYAQALTELIQEDASKGKTYLANLKQILEKRGHEKLFPQILRQYETLETARERVAKAQEVTPERERVRVLFELYKQLTR